MKRNFLGLLLTFCMACPTEAETASYTFRFNHELDVWKIQCVAIG